MSYYDTNVYNYEALKPEDKTIIDYARHLREDVLDSLQSDTQSEIDDESNTLDKIKGEIILETIEDIKKRFAIQELETMVALIDNYELTDN